MFVCEYCGKSGWDTANFREVGDYAGTVKAKEGYSFGYNKDYSLRLEVRCCRKCFDELNEDSAEGEDNAFGVGIWE